MTHSRVAELDRFVDPGTLMVFNDSRVRKARLYGTREKDGKQYEFLFLRARLSPGEDRPGRVWEVISKGTRKYKEGDRFAFSGGPVGSFSRAPDFTSFLCFEEPLNESYFEQNGHVPLPPYIERDDSSFDGERYQTVYAQAVGSAAAPTAGLHFTEELFARLDAKGIERAFVTLHVGLGTFMPVKEENIQDHVMHEERYEVGPETAAAIIKAKAEGRPVLAVGTTSVRTLESAWEAETGSFKRGPQATSIFISPGYKFQVVDRMFTNFHTPESTLLMLVSAFASREFMLDAYKKAVEERYRFFSYGDAMLIQ
jgi:S-adenosylmethionine:tRNA ribosyltransferase-isomerase